MQLHDPFIAIFTNLSRLYVKFVSICHFTFYHNHIRLNQIAVICHILVQESVTVIILPNSDFRVLYLYCFEKCPEQYRYVKMSRKFQIEITIQLEIHWKH